MRGHTSRSCARWGAAVVAVVVGLAVLTGCTSERLDVGPADLGPGAGGGVFPVTVVHAFGTTVVPRAPRRVVALGYSDSQNVLAFGVKPVGISDQYTNPPGPHPDTNTQWPWVRTAWGSTQPLVVETLESGAPDYERIAALRPDLIVAVNSDIDQTAYDQLAQIAPTIGHTTTEKEPLTAPWQDNALLVGTALGKSAEAAVLIRRVEDEFALVRREHPEYAGQTAVAVQWFRNSVSPFTSIDTRGRILAGLGFRSVPEIDQVARGKFYAVLSPERVDLIDVDRIFVIGSDANQQSLRHYPLFADLRAVREGRVTYLPDSQSSAVGAAMEGSTLPSLPYAIDQIVRTVAP